METRCGVKARPGKSGGGSRLSLPKPAPKRRTADRRWSFHDDKARALKMSNNPLRSNRGRVFLRWTIRRGASFVLALSLKNRRHVLAGRTVRLFANRT
jgi:hypothetical protein